MAANGVLQIILPKKRANPKGIGSTATFNPSNAAAPLTAPGYREHQTDIFDQRSANDSRTLLKELFKHDPDVSASVNAYLTVAASAKPWWIVYDQEGNIDREGHKTLEMIMQSLFSKNDYSLGFQLKPNLAAYCNELRYMALLRGAIATELVLDKAYMPTELRHIDMAQVEWLEKSAGQYKPQQSVPGAEDKVNLDIPTFLVAYYKRDATSVYSYSPFVSAINTIAARQQVINDLYRIMKKTGYPRQSIKVVEEVLRKSAPVEAQQDPKEMNNWMRARMQEIAASVSNLSADQVYVHTDSVEPSMLNEKNPGMEIDIEPIISTLNAQNQAALKTMATIIGRGESGVNTASVESRVFAMHADSLNEPIAQLLSDAFTLSLRLMGSLSRVEFGFDKVELRPELELEPQITMKQNRLMMMLSHGIIDDDEFHVEMFNRPKPDGIEELSGTGFMSGASALDPELPGDQAQPSSMDKANTPKGSGMARSSSSSRRPAP